MTEKKAALHNADLETKTADELAAIAEQCRAIIQQRAEEDRSADLKTVNALLVKHGAPPIRAFEDLAQSKPRGRSRGNAKYRNPADQKQTWSGKGRNPAWVTAHIAAGGKVEDLAISK